MIVIKNDLGVKMLKFEKSIRKLRMIPNGESEVRVQFFGRLYQLLRTMEEKKSIYRLSKKRERKTSWIK